MLRKEFIVVAMLAGLVTGCPRVEFEPDLDTGSTEGDNGEDQKDSDSYASSWDIGDTEADTEEWGDAESSDWSVEDTEAGAYPDMKDSDSYSDWYEEDTAWDYQDTGIDAYGTDNMDEMDTEWYGEDTAYIAYPDTDISDIADTEAWDTGWIEDTEASDTAATPDHQNEVAGNCGWREGAYDYGCGGSGYSDSVANICPLGLVEGDECNVKGDFFWCCDGTINWYCSPSGTIQQVDCQ